MPNPCSPMIRVSFGARFVCAYNMETKEKHIEEHALSWNMIEPSGLDAMYIFCKQAAQKVARGKVYSLSATPYTRSPIGLHTIDFYTERR